MTPDQPEEISADEATGQDVQPPTTASQEWAFKGGIAGSGGIEDTGEPPSTEDLETRSDD
jgi:hypothetical protein